MSRATLRSSDRRAFQGLTRCLAVLCSKRLIFLFDVERRAEPKAHYPRWDFAAASENSSVVQ